LALEKAILLGVNKISTITADSEAGEFVAENMINQQPSEIWQAAGLPSPNSIQISGSLGGIQITNGVAISNSNLTVETLRLELSTDDAFSDVVFDVSWDFTDPLYGWGEGDWGDTQSTFGGYAVFDTAGAHYEFLKTFSGQYAAYYRFTISGLVVVPEIGALFLGRALQSGIARDPEIPIVDPSQIVMTRGQGMRSDSQPTYREFRVRYVGLTTEEAHELRSVLRVSGKRKLVAFQMHPGTEGLNEIETRMICRIVDWTGPVRIGRTTNAQSRWTADLILREAI